MKEKSDNKETLQRFARNNYSRTEYRQVKSMFSRADDELKEELHEHWNDLPVEQPLDNRLKNLLERLNLQLFAPKTSYRRIALNFLQRAAAVLFIPLLIGFGYLFFQEKDIQNEAMATIVSPLGARTEFVLPDGSTGWLNSGSKLSYPVQFDKVRDVKLTGEAYFDVVHKNGEKFRVLTDNLTVQVLGTSFSVSAYKDEPEINIVLKEGKVKVTDPKTDKSYLMKPDEKLIYDVQKNSGLLKQVNAKEQTDWINGVLRFSGEPLEEVVKKLGRWYNVSFEVTDKQLQQYNFKATFKDEQLEDVLRMIAITTPMKYKIEKRKINERGIYEKKRVIIERN